MYALGHVVLYYYYYYYYYYCYYSNCTNLHITSNVYMSQCTMQEAED